jgi:hypothetical protein
MIHGPGIFRRLLGTSVAPVLVLGIFAATGLVRPSGPAGASVPVWNATEAPLPGGAGTGDGQFLNLNAASCISATTCVSVGQYGDANEDLWGVIETLSAGVWTTILAPEPADAGTSSPAPDQSADLASVSCASYGDCIAVGQYRDDNGIYEALIDTLSGGTWTATEAPLPPNAGSELTGDTELDSISCTTATDCTAVGNYSENGGAFDALIDTLAGENWTATEAPLPPNAARATSNDPYPALSSVSCTSDGGCTAVGRYSDSERLSWALIDSLSDGTWTAAEAPEPVNTGTEADGNQDDSLNSVSCSSASSCSAVGTYNDADDYDDGLIESLADGTWTDTEAPQPSNAGTDRNGSQSTMLNSVSCSAVGDCAAVGFYDQKNSQSYGLLETLAGGTWKDDQAREPANAGTGAEGSQRAVLDAVNCPSARSCTAVGSYFDSDGNNHGLIETRSGRVWRTLEAPEPTDGTTPTGNATSLEAVSCTTDGGCAAVGVAPDDGGLIDTETPAPTPMIITASPLPGGTLKTPYSTALAVSNGNPPYSWKLVSADGALPPGLELKGATGVISGKPQTGGIFTFTVEVLDAKTRTKPHTRATATGTFSITIS